MNHENEKKSTAPAAKAAGYCRPKNAAKFLDISCTTLWTWVRTKEGFPKPFKPTENITLFSVAELDAWMKNTR